MPDTVIDLTASATGAADIGGLIIQTWVVNAGTGRLDPFLTFQANGTESGVNTDQKNLLDNVDGGSRTNALTVGDLPLITVDGREYYSVVLDLNESNSGTADVIDLNQFSLFLSSSAPHFTDLNGNGQVDLADVAATAGLRNVFSLDGGADLTVRLTDSGSNGSGWSDYRILIPREMLGSDPAQYVTFLVQMSGSNATFEEFATLSQVSVAPAPIAGLAIANVGSVVDGALDRVGETVAYTATVTNTGNYALAGVSVTGSNGEAALYTGGDSDGDNLLDLNESWTFDYVGQTAVTQDDLDAGGFVSSTATARTSSDSSVSAAATATNPLVQVSALAVTTSGTVEDGALDELGERVSYTALVQNSGNHALAEVSVTGGNGERGEYVSGDDDGDGLLDVGETWTFTYEGAAGLTQEDLDNGGMFSNMATGANPLASSSGTGQNPIVQRPSIDANLSASVAGGTADVLGERVAYTLTVANTGNVTLDGVVLAGAPEAFTLAGDDDDDGKLDVGETWTYSFEHAVTQADLDGGGTIGADVDVVAGSGTRSAEDADNSASVIVEQKPGIQVESYVSIDGINWYDADAGALVIGQNQPVRFAFVVSNTGNVTLTDVTLADTGVDLNGAAAGTGFTIGTIAPGATATHTITGVWDNGAFSSITTATGTYSAGTTSDTDAVNYFGAFEGPGVRTPGFWSNNGLQFWNGKAGDEVKTGLNFTTNGELSIVGPNGQRGLLLGDWSGNGITDNGERTLFMSLNVAQSVVNASLKVQQDARYVLGRDTVATWLNELAGNDLGDAADAGSPRAQLQSAINWLKTNWDANNDGILSSSEINLNAAAFKTSGANWNGGSLSAATLHNNLDGYNNSGKLGGIEFSADADDSAYFAALQLYLNALSTLEGPVLIA